MTRFSGTVSRGLRAPIIRAGDNLKEIVVNTVLAAADAGEFTIKDKDVIAVTEAVVAKSQGNYATVDQIASDVRNKTGGGTIGVVFPILSRNRFAICLNGMAKGVKKIVLLLSYPSDEMGNQLFPSGLIDEKKVNPYGDVFTESEFTRTFGETRHSITGMNYPEYYKKLIEEAGAEAEIIFSNDPRKILSRTDIVFACDIHTREMTKKLLREAGAKLVFGLDDILTESISGSGYNKDYGILGSNKSTENRIKLFPRECDSFVRDVQSEILNKTGKAVEVMVYGDGAFKDPISGIWELADPVVSPGYTAGLLGSPNEVKLKYIADNEFAGLSGDELKAAVSEYIKNKKSDLGADMSAQGTTPRKFTDLIGSLCDLTSGSGDKGTPIIYIQGYFDNYTD